MDDRLLLIIERHKAWKNRDNDKEARWAAVDALDEYRDSDDTIDD